MPFDSIPFRSEYSKYHRFLVIVTVKVNTENTKPFDPLIYLPCTCIYSGNGRMMIVTVKVSTEDTDLFDQTYYVIICTIKFRSISTTVPSYAGSASNEKRT